MSERINIPAMRDVAEGRAWNPKKAEDIAIVIRKDLVLVLLDAVEAAERYLQADDDHPDLGAFFTGWLKAQARFDFREPE